jgi:L-asparaginase
MTGPGPLHLLALGGTIACVQTVRGLVPGRSAADLLRAIDAEDGSVHGRDLLQRTIVFPEDWPVLGRVVFEAFPHAAGVVITLGTDTLAHAGCALALMLQHPPIPVVLTGAMQPMGATGGDAEHNLRDALAVARARVAGVLVVLDATVHDARRVSKVRCDHRAAFESINAEPLGHVEDGVVLWTARPAPPSGPPALRAAIDARVELVKLGPQTTAEGLEHLRHCTGVVVEGFGDGNLPGRLVEPLLQLMDTRLLVLASQCPYGAVAHRYEGGAALIAGGALSARDMTSEMALVTLMWALGTAASVDDARRLFLDSQRAPGTLLYSKGAKRRPNG